MSSSPLRRALSISSLVASLWLLPTLATEAQASPFGFNDTTIATRLETRGVFARLWDALTHLFAADGSRIDPNGVN